MRPLIHAVYKLRTSSIAFTNSPAILDLLEVNLFRVVRIRHPASTTSISRDHWVDCKVDTDLWINRLTERLLYTNAIVKASNNDLCRFYLCSCINKTTYRVTIIIKKKQSVALCVPLVYFLGL